MPSRFSFLPLSGVAPKGFWNSQYHQRLFLKELIAKKGLGTERSWATVAIRKEITDFGGEGLLQKYPSVKDLFKTHFPDSNWSELQETYIRSKRKNKQYQESFLREFAREHGIQSPKDWNHVTFQQISKYGGEFLVRQYPSVKECISSLIPEYNMEEYDYKDYRVPWGYWKSVENQKKFMDFLSDKLHIKEPKDWNQLACKHIIEYGGRHLLAIYPSIYNILTSVYPHQPWNALTIPRHLPADYWNSEDNAREYLSELVKIENLASPLEIPRATIVANGGKKFLKPRNRWLNHLLSLFPELHKELAKWKDQNKQRQFLNAIIQAKQYSLGPNLWTILTKNEIQNEGGFALMHYYSNSREMFETLYPETCSRNVLEHRTILEKIAVSQNLQTSSDWNALTISKFKQLKGRKILAQYNSFYEMLEKVFPEKQWDPFAFSSHKLPPKFWDHKANQRLFMDKLAARLQISEASHWRNVKLNSLHEYGGGVMIRKYKTLSTMLQNVYPERNWIEELQKYPRNHWATLKNKRYFFQFIFRELELEYPIELLYISQSTICSFGGAHLLRKLDKPYSALLEDIFPDVQWPNLQQIEHQRNYIKEIGERLCVKELSDWYSVSPREFKDKAWALCEIYSSMVEVLMTLYPEYPWNFQQKEEWRMPHKYWDDFEHVKRFLNIVEEHYKIQDCKDWYRISLPQITALGGSGFLAKYRLYDVLCKTYPDFQWDEKKLIRRDKRSVQRWLFLCVKTLFPDEEVVEDYVTTQTRYSGSSVEIDVFLPKYQLAFEYNGEHHYKDIPAFGPMELYHQRDIEKSKLCDTIGVTLISIPYTWDQSINHLRLISQILFPSLFFQTSQ